MVGQEARDESVQRWRTMIRKGGLALNTGSVRVPDRRSRMGRWIQARAGLDGAMRN